MEAGDDKKCVYCGNHSEETFYEVPEDLIGMHVLIEWICKRCAEDEGRREHYLDIQKKAEDKEAERMAEVVIKFTEE